MDPLLLLAAQAETSWYIQLLEPQRLALLIPMLAIVVFGVRSIVVVWARHRERLELIRQGIIPEPNPAEGACGDDS